MIYVDILKNALQDLDPGDAEGRHGLYRQLIAGLKNSLEARKPPADRTEKLVALRLLRSTIQRFDNDLRAGVDVTAEEYVPEGLEDEQARLDAVVAIAQKAQAAAHKTEDYSAETEVLRHQMRELSLAGNAEGYRERPWRPTTLGAVMGRLLSDIFAARGFIGLMWILTEPCLLIGTAVVGYLMLDERSVMNMDVIPFAIVGVVCWLQVRVTLIRVSTAPLMTRELLALPPIHVFSVLLAQASNQYCTYTVSLFGLLLFAAAAGHAEAPENIVLFMGYWTLMWIFGIASGIVMAPFLAEWHSGARASMIGIRFLGWTSGLFFVSEQFPAEMKYYLLWNPLCHGMQLLRSAYFVEYETEDASLFYFLFCLGIMITLAAFSARVLQPKAEPA